MFSPDSAFSRIMSAVFDILVIGIMWFVCSLPLITIAASTTAAYYTMAKVVRFNAGYIREEFFRSFRQNFKQSIGLSLIFVILSFVFVLDLYYVWHTEGRGADMLFVIITGIFFLFMAVAVYICPFLSRFSKTTADLIRTAGFAAFRFLPATIGILITIVICIFLIYLMPWAIVVVPGFFLWAFTYPMERIMRKFMTPPEPGSPESRLWYWGDSKAADDDNDDNNEILNKGE